NTSPCLDAGQSIEHLQVLALDDGPVVIVTEELSAVPAERHREPSVVLEHPERLHKLETSVIVEPRAAPDALSFEDIALRVCQHRSSERPSLERHHREAFEIRRHDQELGRGDRIELVSVVEKPEMSDARVGWNLQH